MTAINIKNINTPKRPSIRFKEFSQEWEVNKFSRYIRLYRGSSPRPISKFITKNDLGVNWIKIGDTKNITNYIISSVEEKITKEGAEKSRRVEKGELILANSMSFGQTYELQLNGCIYDGWFVLRDYENYFYKPFLLQLLNSDFMQKQYVKFAAGGIVQNISSDIVYDTILCRPSLEEQTKIANFLAKLDERIATQRELIYYYEFLILWLSKYYFEKGDVKFNINPLKKICSITKGQQINASELTEKGEFYVMNGGILPSGYHSDYNVDENTISISEGGNSCGYVQFNTEKFWSGGHCYTLHNINKSINLKYLYYFLKYKEKYIMRLRIGGALPNIQKRDLENFEIKIPITEYQNQIVKVLDSISEKLSIEKQLLAHYQEQKKYFLQNMFV